MSINDLLPGWPMPNDLAKQVKDSLYRKSITPEQELQDALEEMARDMALIEPNPVDWAGWVTYKLERLEVEAERRGKSGDFEEIMSIILNGADSVMGVVLRFRIILGILRY